MSRRFSNLKLPDSWRNHYNQLWYAKHAVRYAVSGLAALVVIIGAAFFNAGAWEGDVLHNGNFEHGYHVEPCGLVGNHWHCFTNGGNANYGFYDEQWPPVVSEGVHGQLIEINTKGVGIPDPDRYAGIYQTIRVTDWAEYELSFSGMIRTTNKDGDPWRYRVQVGWTPGSYGDWTTVTNWTDVGWDTYYDRVEPGTMSRYSTKLTATDDYITVYIRFWKKWGIGEEEILLNLDDISLMGLSYGSNHPAPAPVVVHPTAVPPTPVPYTPPSQPYHPPHQPQPHQPYHPVACGGPELIYNGGFDHGFNFVGIGHVGKSWGSFTNGGAAEYGFYDEQWSRVVADGTHGQLIEINAKNHNPADHDRYAGIYQRITGLTPGVPYKLSLKGLLRGAGDDPDPHRFEAQWGFTNGHDTDWTHVNNWTSMDLGPIHERTEPGAMAMYSTKFAPNSDSIVLFIRGWKKWGIYGVEMDMNLDAISLHSCGASVHHPKPAPVYPTPVVTYPTPVPVYPTPAPVHPAPVHPAPAPACVYTVQPGDSLGAIAERYWVSVHDLAEVNGIYNIHVVYIGQKLHIPGCSAATAPVVQPTAVPTVVYPTAVPTVAPPTAVPTVVPPTAVPTVAPPTAVPTVEYPTAVPTVAPPTAVPTVALPTVEPTVVPPTAVPTVEPPTAVPTVVPPTAVPTVVYQPTAVPTVEYKPVVAPTLTPAPVWRTHVVQPGETLSGICLHYGVDYEDVMRYNHISNPNWIYVGQVLTFP